MSAAQRGRLWLVCILCYCVHYVIVYVVVYETVDCRVCIAQASYSQRPRLTANREGLGVRERYQDRWTRRPPDEFVPPHTVLSTRSTPYTYRSHKMRGKTAR